MFRAIISPILRSTRLCLQLWYNAPTMLPAGGRQHLRCTCKRANEASDSIKRGNFLLAEHRLASQEALCFVK